VDPSQLAAKAVSRLRAQADPAVATRSRTYFKPHDRVRFFGVRHADVRRLARDLRAAVDGSWGAAEAIAFCERMLGRPEMEAKTLGCVFLGRYRETFPRGLFRRAGSWLARGDCDNWAAVDTLCPEVVTPLVAAHPDLLPRLAAWGRSRNLWLRRASLVTLVPLARRGERLGAAYAAARSLLGDEEDLIHKAAGWLLREAGRTDDARLERFLRRHGPRVPRTTLRYAIERMPAARRRAIMAATRRRG